MKAVNSIGLGGFSPIISATTLASSPAAVSGLRCATGTATSFGLCWNVPLSNGSPITHYNVEVGEKGIFPTQDVSNNFDVNDLTPDTTYRSDGPIDTYSVFALKLALSSHRIRVQAVNSIGVGPFSTPFKFSTLPLPPDAPRLECIQSNHNSLKLRWGDGKNLDLINYFVEMQEEGSEKYCETF